MPLAVFPAASKHTYHCLPTLVLPRSGSSGRRHGSRPLSPVARAPVFIVVLHCTPALRPLSTPCLACLPGALLNTGIKVDQPRHLIYPVRHSRRRYIHPRETPASWRSKSWSRLRVNFRSLPNQWGRSVTWTATTVTTCKRSCSIRRPSHFVCPTTCWRSTSSNRSRLPLKQ